MYMACGGSLTPCATANAPGSGGCVCDQESDNKLGATLGVMNAPAFPDIDKIYVSLRATVNLQGTINSSDKISRTASATLRRPVLGAHRECGGSSNGNVWLLQSVYPVIVRADAGRDACLTSVFRGKRVAAATACTALKAMRSSLFP